MIAKDGRSCINHYHAKDIGCWPDDRFRRNKKNVERRLRCNHQFCLKTTEKAEF